ncbi:MAG: cytochrome c biogenesis heme-transporting ATPase CcmA [Methylococcaceae bacterium]|nr:MAG: cytochrome c biogenesis heme-transporting ATPase CcmA [Methylococcaceae bacterium]
MGKPLLEATQLECQRGDRVLFSGLNFSITAGSLLLIEGENGAGKTSLLRLLCGLSRPAAGDILWRGIGIHTQRSVYHGEMAYLGHHGGVKLELSTLENLAAFCALRRARSLPEMEEALYQVGLNGFEDAPGRRLSAGQKQRLTLARLLLSGALLWVLDEPYTALDVDGIALVNGMLERHAAHGGSAILTSHQPVSLNAALDRLRLGA